MEHARNAYQEFKREFKKAIGELSEPDGIATFTVDREKVVEVITALKSDAMGGFDYLTDLCGVDWLACSEPCRTNLSPEGYRFEVVYHLYSMSNNDRIRIKVRIPDDDPFMPTVTHLFKAANWLEREVWDMFGISFKGHPDMRRILMWEGFDGSPLRKDFPLRGKHPIKRTLET